MKTALQAGRAIRERKISAPELLEETFRNIDENEKKIRAYTRVFKEEARARAREVQAKIDAGEELSPLAGVPMGIKDNISTKDFETSCASRSLSGYIPAFDATAAERLREAGAVLVGKCNMDEFAMGGSTETSFYGKTRNPWDLGRVPGGSSGGSAAAVAAGEAFYTLGSDTGGSIRQPCSFCGVSGIKPTYGAVSRWGLVAYASSLDQIGPIGRDVADCAEVLKIIAGHDGKDSTSSKAQLNLGAEVDVKGLKIGLPSEYLSRGIDGGVLRVVKETAGIFEEMGASVSEFDFKTPRLADYAAAAYYVTACAEASSNLSRYDGVKYGYAAPPPEDGEADLAEQYIRARSEGFGIEVKRRLMLGAFVLSSGFYDAYYRKAQKARALLSDEWAGVFEKFDVVLSPVAPTAAYRLGENVDDPLKMLLGDMYTVAVNMAGLPSVAAPAGFSEGLPVGVQLIGKKFSENTLIEAARAFQGRTDFHLKSAPIV
ncbi:MAG: Asp-tRNA(Asn)/Glu-tRNA(Gln) amidotransferase subunit GatA [Clostridiales bacterium]|jgi:aspartyl-tRNA(Asn)/glutamyl-tRNA(Gln) amidotransferase subunit A|nr:Asp-tRNA(Asn)/Glu-tRNA(Gln) amidotransferase subunit GatA [Clostridiales bacterium]